MLLEKVKLVKTKCNETVLPAAHANKEERNGNEVTLVPHILSILSYPLCKSHAAHKECLNEREKESDRERRKKTKGIFLCHRHSYIPTCKHK